MNFKWCDLRVCPLALQPPLRRFLWLPAPVSWGEGPTEVAGDMSTTF